MSDLQIQYSKEIAKELGKIAVYLPGENIEVGEIIKFPNSKKPIFGKKLPFGAFRKVTSLQKLGVNFNIPEPSGTPDTYRFSSQNKTNVQVGLSGNGDLGNDSLPSVKEDLHIEFSSEGAIFFLAIDCDKRELDDLLFLEKEINSKGKQLVWDDTYLVTSVTIAKKAFIAQSKSRFSEISLKSSLKGIKTPSIDISVDSNLEIIKSSGDLFIKDWSSEVTVFMDLVKFEKKVFEISSEVTRGSSSQDNKTKLIAEKINIQELLKKK